MLSVTTTAISLKSSSRDESNFEVGNENRQSSPAQKSQNSKNNSTRSENKANSRSSDNESPLSSHQTLAHNEKDDSSSKLEESTGNSAEGNGSKSISSIFSGHSKLRRLLGTLVHFAMEISLDTGDTVRSLVLGLLVKTSFLFFCLFNIFKYRKI